MSKNKGRPSMPLGRGGHGRGSRPVEKAKDFKGSLKRLLDYMADYKLGIIMIFILATASTLFLVISPKIMGMVTDLIYKGYLAKLEGRGSIDFTYIGKILAILGLMYIVSGVFSYLQTYFMAGITQKIVYKLRDDVDKKLSRLPLSYYDNHQTGEILSRITNDVDTISSTLQQTVTQLITSLVTIIGITIMMLTISPLMTLVTILVIPLGILGTRRIAKKSQSYFKSQSKSLGNLNGHIEEMYAGHTIIKAFNQELRAEEKFDRINEDLYEYSYKAHFVSGIIRPLMGFINNIGYVLVSVIGGFLVISNRISIGEIQSFIQYSRQFSQPLMRSADIANTIQSTIASAERVFEVLDETEEFDEGSIELEKGEILGEVSFQNVDFSYNKDKELIKDMTINVKPGDTVAIVGPTGAGKTTLVNLLMVFYKIDRGRILIDKEDIYNFKKGSLRRNFGMVLQDTWLFKGSIKDNIAYGKEDATDEEICQAAKISQADYFIRTLADGYDTILDEDAGNISQGQKQLLTIARAIVADPDIMILDEATSSVDTRTEILIQKAMDKVMENRTSFVIAHRLSTIRNADTILVMDQGRLIEQGSHDELMEKGGFYKELYNSQFVA